MDAALNNVGTSSALDGDDAVPDDMAIGFGRTGARPASWTSGLYGKGAIMKRSKPNLAVLALLFIIGVGTLFHFSQNVRIVDLVGLSGGGAACGAAMFGLIFALMARNKA